MFRVGCSMCCILENAHCCVHKGPQHCCMPEYARESALLLVCILECIT